MLYYRISFFLRTHFYQVLQSLIEEMQNKRKSLDLGYFMITYKYYHYKHPSKATALCMSFKEAYTFFIFFILFCIFYINFFMVLLKILVLNALISWSIRHFINKIFILIYMENAAIF